MNVNNLMINTLSPLGYPVAFNEYMGEKQTNNTYKKSDTYITFNYEDDRGETYADDEPQDEIAYLQIHLFTPLNYMSLKKEIRSKLFGAGFSYPTVTEIFETTTKKNHVVFQCYFDGLPETEE